MSVHLTIFGATSGIGKIAMETALAKGHRVRAFARSADDMAARDGLETMAGDALDPADVGAALEGTDAVIYALGIKESVSMLWTPVTLFSDSTRLLLDCMAERGPRRLVAVTGFGAGRSRNAMSAVERAGHWALLGRPYADKDRQEELIRNTAIDWTIVRPVILTNGGASGRYRVLREPSEWRNGLISRKDVADYLVEAATSDLDIRRDVVLAR